MGFSPTGTYPAHHQETVADPPRETVFGEVYARITELAERIEKNAAMADTIGNGIFGATPQPANNQTKPREVRSGALGEIHDALDRLSVAVEADQQAIATLRKLV